VRRNSEEFKIPRSCVNSLSAVIKIESTTRTGKQTRLLRIENTPKEDETGVLNLADEGRLVKKSFGQGSFGFAIGDF
jgi:hypothetical protein